MLIFYSIVWTLLVLGSFTGLLTIFFQQTTHYLQYPTYTKTVIDHVTEMTFPAITICNLSPRNKSRLPNQARDDYWRDTLLGIGTSINWTDPRYQTEEYYRQRTTTDVCDESMQLQSMCISGQFLGEDINVSNDFTQFISTSGLCYTWNKHGTAKTNIPGVFKSFDLMWNVNLQHYAWAMDSSVGVRVIFDSNNYILNFELRISVRSC